MIEISGLWKNESKDGKTVYLVGYMGKAKILVFKNTYKKAGTEPDYIMYVDKKTRPEKDDSENDVPF